MARTSPHPSRRSILSRRLDEAARVIGFHSTREYLRSIARRKGIRSAEELWEKTIIKLKNEKISAQRLARWTMVDCIEFVKSVKPHRNTALTYSARRLRNKILSSLMKRRLEQLSKNQRWLANRLKISRQAVHQYSNGTVFPGRSVLARLVKLLAIRKEALGAWAESSIAKNRGERR